jgi:hypothetical protein
MPRVPVDESLLELVMLAGLLFPDGVMGFEPPEHPAKIIKNVKSNIGIGCSVLMPILFMQVMWESTAWPV